MRIMTPLRSSISIGLPASRSASMELMAAGGPFRYLRTLREVETKPDGETISDVANLEEYEGTK
jgi:hypothetical protein